MTHRTLGHLLGTGGRDPGCVAAFEVFDQYVEAVRKGLDVQRLFPDFVTHLRNCAACREDTEGLMAALDDLERLPPAR